MLVDVGERLASLGSRVMGGDAEFEAAFEVDGSHGYTLWLVASGGDILISGGEAVVSECSS